MEKIKIPKATAKRLPLYYRYLIILNGLVCRHVFAMGHDPRQSIFSLVYHNSSCAQTLPSQPIVNFCKSGKSHHTFRKFRLRFGNKNLTLHMLNFAYSTRVYCRTSLIPKLTNYFTIAHSILIFRNYLCHHYLTLTKRTVKKQSASAQLYQQQHWYYPRQAVIPPKNLSQQPV